MASSVYLKPMWRLKAKAQSKVKKGDKIGWISSFLIILIAGFILKMNRSNLVLMCSSYCC